MNAVKLQRTVLRLWISAASVGSFVLGWAILAQSPSPSQSASPSGALPRNAAVVLPPVPTLDPGLLQGAPNPALSPLMLPSLPQRGPVFSTGGS